ncbi:MULTISPECIES: RNA-binding S4 domain-containing protein [unclassified Aeromicrobium]|jgi:ribosome-associated protein|uniref:RNA-binding S4 domain-containing protein n=1 Tax=unclassified Aeromicrobium TaxID=2633570 RepID=UPI000AC054AD|nr:MULTISPECIES: RNA-binding S4 domain-containing protein [unclassified Aeromicrobium]
MTGPDDVETIAITSDMIRLGQLLKFADVAESGAQAGALVASGDVQVDGEVETRRGRQLGDDAVVTVALPEGPRVLRVVTGDDVDVPW